MRASGSRVSQPARGSSAPLPVIACFVALFAGLLYLNALRNPFVYDDYRLIVENTSILNLQDLPGIVYPYMTRPLVNLSYAVDAAMWGRQPFGFHLTSVLLHMLNVGLVVYVAWLVAEDRRRQRGQFLPATASSVVIATATATLFAAHPLMTQAVGYISGRSEVLYVAFFLLAFLSARYWMVHGGTQWWLATIGLWVFSLLAKETGVMLGFVLLCYDQFVLDGDLEQKRRRLLTLHLPLLSMALLAGVVRVAVLTEVEYPGQFPGDWRFTLVAFDVFWRYLSLVIVPQNQTIFHEIPAIENPFAPGALAAVVGLVALLVGAWRLRACAQCRGTRLLLVLPLAYPVERALRTRPRRTDGGASCIRGQHRRISGRGLGFRDAVAPARRSGPGMAMAALRAVDAVRGPTGRTDDRSQRGLVRSGEVVG